MRKGKFEGWVFIGIGCGFLPATPKLLTVFITFLKLKGGAFAEDLLQQEIWKLKVRPEAFIQKVPPRAKCKLEVRMYDESFGFEPDNYTKISWYENSVGDEKTEIVTGGKKVNLAFFKSSPLCVPFSQAGSAYKYRFAESTFNFAFMHPLTGKDPHDKLYQFTKDVNCSFGSSSFMPTDNGYTGKFCAANRPFTLKDLLPYILKSMDKQFDFLEANGERMQWYEEFLEELKNPSIIVEPTVLDRIDKRALSGFYTENYTQALAQWDRLGMDYLLGEEEEEEK